MSVEVDIAPLNDDDAGSLATLIDGAIGEWSPFHETHGFYVQGVGRETPVLPAGWEQRLVPVAGPATNGRTGLCLDPHDLCIAKLAAAREKDFRFVAALIDSGLVDLSTLSTRAQPLSEDRLRSRVSIGQWLDAQRLRADLRPPDVGL